MSCNPIQENPCNDRASDMIALNSLDYGLTFLDRSHLFHFSMELFHLPANTDMFPYRLRGEMDVWIVGYNPVDAVSEDHNSK